ncbi:GD15293 [Drosophila simulans]|uniref:GD15293 n=1 Tax=Drosophila simulans TaxID=7240 RepID=B4NS77_DROSI|nr:GD15293 [Drosophila simulans]
MLDTNKSNPLSVRIPRRPSRALKIGANGAPSMPPIRNIETTADIIMVIWESPSRDEYRTRADSIIHDLMN